MLGYCDFGECLCNNLTVTGDCLNDTLDKCIHPLAVARFKVMGYIENEPPKPNYDLVEVIRCKNCEYWDETSSNSAFPEYHRCGFWWINHVATKPDEFCSHGARKMEENCE